MTRLLLRALNAPALILLVTFGVAIQTSLFSCWPLSYFQPDIVLIAVIWCALRRNFTEGGILVLIAAEIAEIHSAAPRGVFLITYMLLYLLVRGASKLFVIPDLASFIIVTLFGSIFSKFSNMTVLHYLAPHTSQWRNTLFLLFPGAAVEGFAAIWLYRWLEKFDALTFKDKRTEESLENELQLQDEGF
ncbi:MAG TPA: hypothetical protein VJB59_11555 [Bdellovibrionota bacterium]|nr:hypothetical protein [Bdellovibrionota bacterium]